MFISQSSDASRCVQSAAVHMLHAHFQHWVENVRHREAPWVMAGRSIGPKRHVTHLLHLLAECVCMCAECDSLHCVKRVLSSWRQLNSKLEIMTITLVVHKLFRMQLQGEVHYLSNKWVDINLSEHGSAINLLLSSFPFPSRSLCALALTSSGNTTHLSKIASFTINQVLQCELHWVCSKQEVKKTIERHNFISLSFSLSHSLLICLC